MTDPSVARLSEPSAALLAQHQPPPSEPTWGDPAPDGYHYEWTVAHDGWALYTASARRCRFTIGPGHTQCKRPAVATLNRALRGARPNLWGYCEDHLYGRVLHDGALWNVVLRPDSGQGADDV